ncbi:MAG TPA: DUF4136 domain-containing protein [Syntrophales bacterium]|nr:DUF4136 domain-containing protein [Syntrophales bacterium]HOX95690.1 DUF4136 domain-containing protein [Syntrophales bacterium]HPI57114.1 DUF4136 domain-containing protein [Syntrophales bacterium]HPN24799.1 DUF4136 domain-containing protein [Syntrophales bacterium]HQM30086.1 DUF4136 domain-containing protein [Syntrophales bacterium]
MAGRNPSACTVLLALTFLLTSCTSTKLVETWRDKQFKGPAFKKIMVVSLMKQPDTRQRVEDEFAGQLNARGVNSITCHSCIPDIKNVTRDEIVKAVGRTGMEGVLVVELRQAGVRVETVRTERPTLGDSIGLDSYLLKATSLSDDSTMVKRDEVVTISARLFDARTGKLIWYSNTETVDPGKKEREIESFVKIILKALQKDRLI